jgi:CRP/FNR family transcriptional regulator, dissimilatory nitrate respiration regulator
LIRIKSPKHAGVSPTEIVERCRLFARLQPAARARLASLALLREFDAGATLFRQGDPCPGVFIVGHGLVRVFKLAPSGKEQVLHIAGPGATFAEAAVIGGFDCPAFAQAVEAGAAAMIPTAAFQDFLHSDHQGCIDLLASLAGWLHHVVDLLEDLTLRDAAGRLARHLIQHGGEDGQVQLPSMRKHLASQLNLTPETLSRTLRRLDGDGCIRTERDAILILDPQRLSAVADGLYPGL